MAVILYGSFDVYGFWQIDCKIQFNGEMHPRPDIINLKIDSGAETSVLSPDVAEKLGKGYDALPTCDEGSIGGSGECNARVLTGASFIFYYPAEDREIVETPPKLRVPDPDSWQRNYSLLGIDILNKYRVIADYRRRKVVLKLNKPIPHQLIANVDFHKDQVNV